MKSNEVGLTKARLTVTYGKTSLENASIQKNLYRLPLPSPSLFKRALIEIQAHNNLYSITMQFH